MGLKQSKRSFEVTTGSPKKDAAAAGEPKAEVIENKDATAPTNGDIKPADQTNGEVSRGSRRWAVPRRRQAPGGVGRNGTRRVGTGWDGLGWGKGTAFA